MNDSKLLALDYFAGGVPAGAILIRDINKLRKIVDKSEVEEERLNTTAEVCFIGLIAYFEAFCENHFASIINICPELIKNFRNAGMDDTINATDLLKIDEQIKYKLGFLISEQCDFGSSKKINAIYQAILQITPFSKNESHRFNRILNDRNLIVHHGGIFTMRYSEQVFVEKQFGQFFMDSLVVGKKFFFKEAEFIEKIAIKTAKASQKSLKEFINSKGIAQNKEQKEAIEFLTFRLD